MTLIEVLLERQSYLKELQGCIDAFSDLQREGYEGMSQDDRVGGICSKLPVVHFALLGAFKTWLEKNCHPHVQAIVHNTQIEVLEGLAIASRIERQPFEE